jgi:superfamily II DNA or RNA helicase
VTVSGDRDVLAAEEQRLAELEAEVRATTARIERLADTLRDAAPHVIVLRGGDGSRRRREVLAELAAVPRDEQRLVLATGRYIGEGFDDARLDTLFLALPVSWKGTVVQYAGRLLRRAAGKTEVRVHDYVDALVPMLARMAERRLRGYRSIGFAEVPAPAAGAVAEGRDAC